MSGWAALFIVLGLVALAGGAEALVRGAARLSVAAGVSPLVVGLTVVAWGTSSPEVAVSLHAAVGGRPDVALGNVVGSNIANVLLILGLCATVTPLVVARQLVRLEAPLLVVVSLSVMALAFDGAIGRMDGLALMLGAVGYTVLALWLGCRDQQTAAQGRGAAGLSLADWPGAVALRFLAAQAVLMVAGLGLLVIGARWLVDGAVAAATQLGLSPLVIGLTIVAVGTSLPEIAASVIAGLRGQRDMAVGNAMGSCLFNLLGVLGMAGSAAPTGIPVAPAVLHFDMPVMAATAAACLPVFFTGHLIARWEGVLFLAYYAAYLTYLVLNATGHDALPPFNIAMVGFVLPLTAITLGVLAAREVRWHTKRKHH